MAAEEARGLHLSSDISTQVLASSCQHPVSVRVSCCMLSAASIWQGDTFQSRVQPKAAHKVLGSRRDDQVRFRIQGRA